jgi:ABC-type Zn uptake system ZnuABC Zn-binding protein ZnuA
MNVSLMLPAQLGCPHDYVLTPQDMQKLAKADILIINGLGMEEFIGAPLAKANPQLKIINSSAGIRNIIQYKAVGHENGHHHHAGANPHLFASPRMAALLAKNIANELAKIDPAGSKLYFSNARAYAEKMNKLAEDFSAMVKKRKNNRIVTQHGVLDYLARDTGLKVVAVVQPHAGQEPSASEMLEIIQAAKHKKAGAIFTEPQYPEKIGRTIGKEAGIANATLDPVATGPENAPLNYYETIMRKNLTILVNTLGTR